MEVPDVSFRVAGVWFIDNHVDSRYMTPIQTIFKTIDKNDPLSGSNLSPILEFQYYLSTVRAEYYP